jgi:hypothetical protein
MVLLKDEKRKKFFSSNHKGRVMKSYLFTIALGLLMLATPAFAQEVAQVATEAPVWLADLLQFIAGIPKVGPIAVEVFKWLGVIASVFTALSVCLTVVLKIPEVAAKWAGAPELAEKIAKLNEKIQPWLKYLSVFNVQKPK